MNHPALMGRIIESEVVQMSSDFFRGRAPGIRFTDSYDSLITVANTLSSRSPNFSRVIVALKVIKGVRIAKQITDHLGGLQAIRTGALETVMSAAAFYRNYTVMTVAGAVFGDSIGTLATGITSARSVAAKVLGVGVGGATYYLTGSQSLTALSITITSAIAESALPTRLAGRVQRFFHR